ncbi:hypothetical protein E0H26_28970 [Micromonospora zingiberis]|uniref:DUF4232 domain-containing protein n=1 Tax=Micromonospora zingiberis TaxID=2053011 RepID=A0A4R0FVJ9_9ACTN|nr:hypothetical protein [Micromonospora zingiberis]TCB87392.1 hypothetical protein E0H26_28970 [Micromonospora zingiberis]
MRKKLAKLGLLCGLMLAATGATGCGAGEPASVDVQLWVNVCVEGDADCFFLGVPEAEVSLVYPGGQVIATGKSDAAGKVLLPSNGAVGEVRVVVVSPLIEAGRKESPLMLPYEGGTNITIAARRGSYSPAGD